MSRSALSPWRDDELVESELRLSRVGDVSKKLCDDSVEVRLSDRIEIVLAVSAAADQPRLAQQGQMMADGRLTLLKPFAKRRNMQFGFSVQIHQDAQACLVGEQLEELDQIVLELVGKLVARANRVLSAGGAFSKFEHFILNEF
jgi:hypothetical protein